jgi:hypothetical protein
MFVVILKYFLENIRKSLRTKGSRIADFVTYAWTQASGTAFSPSQPAFLEKVRIEKRNKYTKYK